MRRSTPFLICGTCIRIVSLNNYAGALSITPASYFNAIIPDFFSFSSARRVLLAHTMGAVRTSLDSLLHDTETTLVLGKMVVPSTRLKMRNVAYTRDVITCEVDFGP